MKIIEIPIGSITDEKESEYEKVKELVQTSIANGNNRASISRKLHNFFSQK
ncbi:MAG: hypothetical protein AAF518_19255 [Spirochaetota bacterium]